MRNKTIIKIDIGKEGGILKMKKYLLLVTIIMLAVSLKAADFDLYGRIGFGAWWMNTERFYDDSVGIARVIFNQILTTVTNGRNIKISGTFVKIDEKNRYPLIEGIGLQRIQ